MTAEQRALVLKAARRWEASDRGKTAYATLNAFGEVAADILKPQMVLAPFGFTMAIEAALAKVPIPFNVTVSRETAQAQRATWEVHFLAQFEREIR